MKIFRLISEHSYDDDVTQILKDANENLKIYSYKNNIELLVHKARFDDQDLKKAEELNSTINQKSE